MIISKPYQKNINLKQTKRGKNDAGKSNQRKEERVSDAHASDRALRGVDRRTGGLRRARERRRSGVPGCFRYLCGLRFARMDPAARLKGAETAGGAGPDPGR